MKTDIGVAYRLKSELAGLGITLNQLAREMTNNGCAITASTLSQKINGKYDFTIVQARCIQQIINAGLSLSELFERKKS